MVTCRMALYHHMDICLLSSSFTLSLPSSFTFCSSSPRFPPLPPPFSSFLLSSSYPSFLFAFPPSFHPSLPPLPPPLPPFLLLPPSIPPPLPAPSFLLLPQASLEHIGVDSKGNMLWYDGGRNMFQSPPAVDPSHKPRSVPDLHSSSLHLCYKSQSEPNTCTCTLVPKSALRLFVGPCLVLLPLTLVDMVVQLSWLSGRALAAQARGVLGLTPGGSKLKRKGKAWSIYHVNDINVYLDRPTKETCFLLASFVLNLTPHAFHPTAQTHTHTAHTHTHCTHSHTHCTHSHAHCPNSHTHCTHSHTHSTHSHTHSTHSYTHLHTHSTQ